MKTNIEAQFELTRAGILMQCLSAALLIAHIALSYRTTKMISARWAGLSASALTLLVWLLPLFGALFAYAALTIQNKKEA